jgi:hypothetical protein
VLTSLLLLGCVEAYDPDDADTAPIVADDHPCADVVPGPWSGHPLASADLTASPPSEDAGLQALFDAMPPEGQTVSVDLLVDGAVVINTGFGGGNEPQPIWLQDASGGVRTFDVPGLVAYQPGDRLSFRVTSLTNYFGELEIVGMEDLELIDTGASVQVVSAGSQPLRFPDQRGQNVEFAGLYTGDSSDDCGDNPCLEIDNGVTVQTLDLRGAYPEPLTAGETCLHVLSPVEFTRGDVRLGATNFAWMQTYESQ